MNINTGSRVLVRRWDNRGLPDWHRAKVVRVDAADERIYAVIDGETAEADYHISHVRIPPVIAI